jgi:hypothetical protein
MFHPPSATFTPSLELCAGAQTFYPGEASCHIISTQESRASVKLRFPPDPGPFIYMAARLILTFHPGNMYAAGDLNAEAQAFSPDELLAMEQAFYTDYSALNPERGFLQYSSHV